MRPYKHAWSVDDAMAHLQAQSGRHFDPDLVPVFLTLRTELETIRARWRDEAPEPALEDCLG